MKELAVISSNEYNSFEQDRYFSERPVLAAERNVE
jgi:hypothetical protein